MKKEWEKWKKWRTKEERGEQEIIFVCVDLFSFFSFFHLLNFLIFCFCVEPPNHQHTTHPTQHPKPNPTHQASEPLASSACQGYHKTPNRDTLPPCLWIVGSSEKVARHACMHACMHHHPRHDHHHRHRHLHHHFCHHPLLKSLCNLCASAV